MGFLETELHKLSLRIEELEGHDVADHLAPSPTVSQLSSVVAPEADGSGTGRYGAHGHWTDGDPANYDGYPVASYGTGLQESPVDHAVEPVQEG